MTIQKQVRLSDVCRQDRTSVKAGQRAELAYIGLESIESNTGRFNEAGLSKTPEVPLANSFRFGPEHVLYGKLRPYLNKVALAEFEGKCSTEIIPLLPSPDLDRRFLAYFLRSPSTVSRISEKAAGARMPRADMDFIFSLELVLPSLTEQRRIVDLLSRAEGIVRLRRDAQKKAAELIPAIFVNIFGDPAMNPKWWPVYELGELLAAPPTLGTMAKPSTSEADWLDLRVANIQGGLLTLGDRKWLDLPPEQIDRFSLKAGDIVLARAIGSLDHLGKAVVVHPTSNWTFDSHLMRIRLDAKRILPDWLVAFLASAGGRAEFLKHTRHSAVQFNINGKEIRRLRIPLPPLGLQQQFYRRSEDICSITNQQTTATARALATFNALLANAFVES